MPSSFLVLLHSVGEVADCRRIVKDDSLLPLPRWQRVSRSCYGAYVGLACPQAVGEECCGLSRELAQTDSLRVHFPLRPFLLLPFAPLPNLISSPGGEGQNLSLSAYMSNAMNSSALAPRASTQRE